MVYTIQNIAEILASTASIFNTNSKVDHLAIDSRRVSFPATTLFFALQTERRDAHIFILELYERGVINFVVNNGYRPDKSYKANFIFVDNTLQALQNLASYHRSLFNYPVIGITGSNGKTIVKEWLYQLLSPDYNIIRSPRSYNSQVGVPLSVWHMSEEYNLAIFEAGISYPREMDALERIIKPRIGVFTNIGEAHGENFEDTLQKAIEKFKLFKEADVIIYSTDDPVIKDVLSHHLLQKQLFSWGEEKTADVRIIEINKQLKETHITVLFQSADFFFTIPFTDDASINNAILCISVLLYIDIPYDVIKKRLVQLQAIEMRLQLVQGINDCTVVNDSYSFDISSFSIALDFLVQQQERAQKVVIISDIPSAKNNVPYEQVSEMLFLRKIEHAITIGEQWNTFRTILTNKIPVTEHYNSTLSFIQNFNQHHFNKKAILLKGGRVFEFEKIVALLEKKVHQTIMEINLTALIHNLNQYRSCLRKGVKIMAMVKAFAYGSGSAEVAHVLQFHKVDYLSVAYADEGVELRKAGISIPIMVMNVDEAAFETIIQHNLEPELFSPNIFRSFNDFLQRNAVQLYPVHIKLDTGMHRLGFEKKDLTELISLLQRNQNIVVQSVFSHLAASEDPSEDDFTNKQANTFEEYCAQVQEALGYNFLMHLSNSAATFRNTFLQYNMVRLGIGLYGVDSSNQFKIPLSTVATLKTTIAQIRNVQAGDTVGYNRYGILSRDSVVATIRIGYADGFSRRLSCGNGKVYINGSDAPVVGMVSMDMTMVDITNIPGVKEGDEVEIFGNHISVQQVAKWCNTISYEILASINQRVKRIYIEE